MIKGKIQTFQTDENIKIFHFNKFGKFKKIKTLGEGTFGKVFLVKQIDSEGSVSSKEFAVKVSKRFKKIENHKNKDLKENIIQNTDYPNDTGEGEKKTKNDDEDEKPQEINFVELRELTIMKTISHPNVVNLLDFKIEPKNKEIWILMDYLPINLKDYLGKKRNDSNILNEDFFKSISYQLISAVNYLHAHQILHRDLKLENILFDEIKNIVRVGDFGLSRQFTFDNSLLTDAGTFPYKPPEVILGHLYYSTSFDVWSLGCVLSEIILGFRLFSEKSILGIIKKMYEIFGSFDNKILPGYKSFPNYKHIRDLPYQKGIGIKNYLKNHSLLKFDNDDFFDLIEKLLNVDPTKRILLKDCLNHPWFKDINNIKSKSNIIK